MSCRKDNRVDTRSLEAVVDDYIRHYRDETEREFRFYQIQPSMEKATTLAALAKLPSGKRHPHQRRIPGDVLNEAARRLIAASCRLEASQGFDQLIQLVSEEISAIRGIGELAVYDTATRIGAYLGLWPDKAYVHAGVRTGLRNLGLPADREWIPINALPSEFSRLKPYEVEDCLCIYKDAFAELSSCAKR